jgi:hypothetical protein
MWLLVRNDKYNFRTWGNKRRTQQICVVKCVTRFRTPFTLLTSVYVNAFEFGVLTPDYLWSNDNDGANILKHPLFYARNVNISNYVHLLKPIHFSSPELSQGSKGLFINSSLWIKIIFAFSSTQNLFSVVSTISIIIDVCLNVKDR